MLRKLVLLFILICSTDIAYGQHDYLITEEDILGESCIYIDAKNAWERRRAFTLNKTPYRWLIYDFEYWEKIVDDIRKTYIPETALQKMIESQIQITLLFVADYKGTMIDVSLSTKSRILPMLSKEQLIEIYQKMWTVKARGSKQLTKDQYFRGQIFLVPRAKHNTDERK